MADKEEKLVCPAEVVELVQESIARELGVFPLECTQGVLTVAVESLLSYDNVDILEFVTSREVRQVIHPIEVIRKALDEYYGVEQEENMRIYFRRGSIHVLEDGTIDIYYGGYYRNSYQTGSIEIPPGHPDCGLWTWIHAQGNRFAEIISEDDLEVIREEYHRSVGLSVLAEPRLLEEE
jgi:hypothetical protein